jgi:hypothetical protein
MEDSKHRCYGCGGTLHVKNYNTALPVKGRIGKKYISALHVMRKRSRSLLSLRPRLHSASRYPQGQEAWLTGAGRHWMIIVSNRIPRTLMTGLHKSLACMPVAP